MTESIKSRYKALRPLRQIGALVVATSVGFIWTTTAGAGDNISSVHSRRASCTLVRYYVARYTAATAEAWARGKGATDAEIQTARGCIKPQQTALIGYAAD